MESKNTKVLTRQELYDLVWATPMIDLAKQFKFSDNGLRKVCKKYSIPVPKMGYWQKVRYGKPPTKTPLPPSESNEVVAINILPRSKENLDPVLIVKETIVVPETIEKFHPLVQQTRMLLKKGHERNGRLRAPGNESALDICVSSAQLPRAYRILDTILKVLEQHGVKVGIERVNEYSTYTYVELDGEKVKFELDELTRMVKTEPNKYGYTNADYVPNGKLVLRINDYLGGCQSKWSDGENRKLEDKLASFVNGLSLAAAYIKKSKRERAEEHQRWEDARKEEERKRLAAEEEKERGQALERQAANWQKSRLILELVQAAIAKRGKYDPDSKFAEWVTWATAYANNLDPLRELKPQE
jgi:hypothetical protein